MRLFILSDSPPEKDVQWSEEGIISSYKFIQKLWNLHMKIIEVTNIKKIIDVSDQDNEISRYTNKFIKKITHNLENFSYNVIIANLHEMYSFFSKEINKEYKKKDLLENYEKILITMMPIIPHFANECLQMVNTTGQKVWPTFDEKLTIDEKVLFVIQINGKKRGLIQAKSGTNEDILLKKIFEDKNLSKYLENIEIKKKIFVPNKLMNIII